MPIGTEAYADGVAESRDLSPEMLRGGGWCPELPKTAAVWSTVPCPLHMGAGCCRAPQPRMLPVPGRTGPLAQLATGIHPTPPSPKGLLLLGRSVPGFGARLSHTAPPQKGLGGLSPTTLPVAPSQGQLG